MHQTVSRCRKKLMANVALLQGKKVLVTGAA
ncbi:short-chain dehydrogenase, partial [Acinetobacter baumannii]|nr:short-chain dehydrogenase [Acinetobacter baumannii]